MSKSWNWTRLTLAGITAVSLLAGLGATLVLGQDRDDDDEPSQSEIRIIIEDKDGERLERTIDFGKYDDDDRAFLGVLTVPFEGEGVLVHQIVDDSAAEQAGFEAGDVILEFDGQPIKRSWDLVQSVLAMQPGDRVDVAIARDGRRENVSVELGERRGFGHDFDSDIDFVESLREYLEGLDLDVGIIPEIHMFRHHGFHMFRHHPGFHRPKLGVELVQPTSELREHLGGSGDSGVLVSRVMSGMQAEEGGLLVGDLIVAVDGREIDDAGDLTDALRDADGRTVEIDVVRDGREIALDVFIPEPERE